MYETKQQDFAYIWNTAERIILVAGTMLSDYTGIQEEIGEEALVRPLEKAQRKAKKNTLKTPALMMVTTGFYKSCRVWIDKEFLIERAVLFDPKKDFEYYCED